MKKNFKALLAAWLLMGTSAAQANTNPTLLQITIFEMRVSENTSCTSPITVFTDPAPTPIDFVANSNLGSGTIPNATYRCFMFRISDNITLVPQANDGLCVAGNTFMQDIFNDPLIDVSKAPDGSTITGNNGTDETPWIYFTDSPDANAGNGCYQPTLSANGGPCVLSAVNLAVDSELELVFNFDNKIGTANGSCGANSAPSLSIR